jgi:hypothetical protein
MLRCQRKKMSTAAFDFAFARGNVSVAHAAFRPKQQDGSKGQSVGAHHPFSPMGHSLAKTGPMVFL